MILAKITNFYQSLPTIAADYLKLVYEGRFSILGPKHPSTISARRALIITNARIWRWEPSLDFHETEGTDDTTKEVIDHGKDSGVQDDNTTWRRLVVESLSLVYLHETSLGKYHPETLKSLHWWFVLQVLFKKDRGVDEMLCKALQCLRHPAVRFERFFESLNQERDFALALTESNDQRYNKKGDQLLLEISRTAEQLPETKCNALATSDREWRQDHVL